MVMTMSASATANIHTLHVASQNETEPRFLDKPNIPSESFVPMIKLEQASDHYRVSIVMPPLECRSNWVSWDQGKLRLTIPAINYRNSPVSRPGFIRWISLPSDASKGSPEVMYAQGSIRIIIPRKSWWRHY